MKHPYEFIPNLVVRSPVLPFPDKIDERRLKNFARNAFILEAVYVASPNLYRKLLKWQEGSLNCPKQIKKTKQTFLKYLYRMSSRTTPFGLFAGCSVVEWSKEKPNIKCQHTLSRLSQLDMHYLGELSQVLKKTSYIRDHLLYFPNSSIYFIGNKLRHIRSSYSPENKKVYELSSVRVSYHLKELLEHCHKGMSLIEMKKLPLLAKFEDSILDEYLTTLIDKQIIISELEPCLSKRTYLSNICETLKKIYGTHPCNELKKVVDILEEVQLGLSRIDKNKVNCINAYQEIIQHLTDLGVPTSNRKLFNITLNKDTVSQGIDPNIQTTLLKGWGVLNALATNSSSTNLAVFAAKYYERYGNKEMPLLKVLDSEAGLSYPVREQKFDTFLTKGLELFDNREDSKTSLVWSKKQRLLWSKLNNSLQHRLYAVNIDDKDIKDFEVRWDDVPLSLYIMFKIINCAESQVLIEAVGGTSGANLLGRFTHGNKKMDELVQHISSKEQAQDNNARFAEIVHSPGGREENVIQRTTSREYEIPYLARSAKHPSKQILLKDVNIILEGEKIVLKCAKSGMNIIPRFGSAYNYQLSALPVFRFLCDLQSQGLRTNFTFDWGGLTSLTKFFPRVNYKNVILSPARWLLSKEDFQPDLFPLADAEDIVQSFTTFRKIWMIPTYFCLVEGDNELLVDSLNELSICTFIDTIKRKESISLKEFLYDKSINALSPENELYMQQYIAPLIKTSTSNTSIIYSTPNNNLHIKKHFTPGSEWIYYKLYCGFRSSDEVLAEAIHPLIHKLLQEGLIDQWFFIRYWDPESHLRLRLKVKDQGFNGRIINYVQSYLSPFEQSGVVWRIQLDTYMREIKRYGATSMEHAESLFCEDSSDILNIIRNTEIESSEDDRWLSAFWLLDEWLNIFEFSLKEKVIFTEKIRDKFMKEFELTKLSKQQLNRKFRITESKLVDIFSDSQADQAFKSNLNHRRSDHFIQIVKELLGLHQDGLLEVILQDLVGSFIHMSMNRLFPASQREHEFIVYFYMFRFYRSKVAQLVSVV